MTTSEPTQNSSPDSIPSPVETNDSGSLTSLSSSVTSETSSSSSTSEESTQESQLNLSQPVYKALADCSKPVDDILHHLTSSEWSVLYIV